MENKTYVGVFNKIGTVEITIEGQHAYVASVLGVKEYNFTLLPNTQNNLYTILRYSLKNYFADFMTENKPTKKYEKKNISTLSMFLNYFMPQTSMLETNDLKSVVYGEMEKNPKHYNWEDVDKFRCVQGGSVMESLKRPLLIGFNGFEDDFFMNESMLKINEKAVERLREEQKRKEMDVDEIKLVQNFVNKEIEYLAMLLDYESEFMKCNQDIFYGDLKLFFDVLSSQENLVGKMLEQFMESMETLIDEEQLRYVGNKSRVIGEFLTHMDNEKNEIYKNKAKTNETVISTRRLNVVNICEFVIDNFILYLPYINFMNNYEKLIYKYQNIMVLRACFSEIIQKITNLPVFFKCMLKYVKDEIVEITYLKTNKYSKMLHYVANETYLNGELLRLLRESVNLRDVQDEWDVEKMGRLYAKAICCLVNGHEIFLYIFKDYLGIFDENQVCLHIIGLNTVDLYIFDMRIFLFLSASSFKSDVFKKLEYSRLHYLVLRTNNKESIYEFKEVFYARKYDCKVYSNSRWGKDLILYKRERFCDEDVVFSKLPDGIVSKDTCNTSSSNTNTTNTESLNTINVNNKDTVKNKDSSSYNNVEEHNKDRLNSITLANEHRLNSITLANEQFKKSISNISLIKRNCIRYDNSLLFECVEAFIEETKNNKKYILDLTLKQAHRKINNQKYCDINQKYNKWIDRAYKVHLTVPEFDISNLDLILNSYSDHKVNTIIEITENQMIDILKNIYKKNMLKNLEKKTYLEKIKVLLANLAESRLSNFELHAYNEDLVAHKDKLKIFEVFTRLIDLKIKKVVNKATISDLNEKISSFYDAILYPDDVLRKYGISDTVSYLKEYLLILHSHKQAESILSNSSLKRIVTLFCMFIQRNIYAFLKPCEVAALEAAFDMQSHDSILTIMRQNKFLEKIAHFSLPLYYRDNVLSTMVIYTLYRKEISDTILYQILKIISLNI